jgi:DNA-binding IclR family transcriptional regulator
MTKLTGVQEQVLRTIGEWFNEHGESPSLGDLAKQRRCCRNAVVNTLARLQRAGVLRRRGVRGIEILPLGAAMLREEDNPYL